MDTARHRLRGLERPGGGPRKKNIGFMALLLLGGAAVPAHPPAQAQSKPAPSGQALNQALPFVNSSVFGGRGSDLLPIEGRTVDPQEDPGRSPTRVRLRSAAVLLRHVPLKDGWQVRADYDLENPETTAVSLSLLFPEELCPAGRECSPMGGAFQDLATRFGAQIIEPTLAAAALAKPWAATPGKGYLYKISVPPRRPQRLSHEYRYDLSSGPDWWGVRYLSSAGRWGGPIESVRFTIELKQPTPYVIYPRGFTLERFSEELDPGGSGTTTRLVFTAKGLSTRTDFHAVFPADSIAGSSPAGFCAGFRGEDSAEDLASVLSGYSATQLRDCRNLIYALHGYPFKDPALRARHYGKPPSLPTWADAKSFALAARPENRDFRESFLSRGERAYVKAIGELERRGQKPAAPPR